MKNHILIIARGRNWEISWVSVLMVTALFAGLFISALGTAMYQYWSYHQKSQHHQQQYNQQQQQNRHLRNQLATLNDVHAAEVQNLKHDYSFEIKNLKQALHTAENLIFTLQNPSKSTDEATSLLQQMVELQQHLQQLSSPPQERTNVTPENPISIEKFRATADGERIEVRFELTSVTGTPQAGHVRITPLYENELNKNINFEPNQVAAFFFKESRLFFEEYSLATDNPFSAIRVTAWDSSRKKLLEQNYPIISKIRLTKNP